MFYDVDDFYQTLLCKWFDQQLAHGERKQLRASRLSASS
jgi:hypothetical protein